MKTLIELIDKTDLAEWADVNSPLGTIPLEYGSVFDEDFLDRSQAERIAYVESDHLGQGGFFHKEQGLSTVLASIAECLANQREDNLSEFVIPISAEDRIYLYIAIGDLPSR